MDNLSPEQIKQMIIMLQAMLPNEQTQEVKPDNTDNTQNTTIKTVPNRTIKKDHFVNKFDTMSEAHFHKSDTDIDKALSKHAPTPRMRKYEARDVKCRVCGKAEQVNPALLPESADRYKCNECSRSSG
jgi:hypothetical protein